MSRSPGSVLFGLIRTLLSLLDFGSSMNHALNSSPSITTFSRQIVATSGPYSSGLANATGSSLNASRISLSVMPQRAFDQPERSYWVVCADAANVERQKTICPVRDNTAFIWFFG